MIETCNLCEKDMKGFGGFVWYDDTSPETRLCRSCLLKWSKTKECRNLIEKYKEAKPTTKLWYDMCKAQQEAFDKWFYANGGKDE